ncbi:MAG: ABC transporter permease [Chloroflexi bacterium]|nr:ABC transporter permease [Chloroflexota bacterium]
MNFKDCFITAVRVLIANKMRSALTILGIVIGVSSVVFLISFGRGHEANLMAIFKSLGADTLYVTSSTQMTDQISGITRRLTMDDADALANTSRAPSIAIVSPLSEKMATVTYANEKVSTDIMGIIPNIHQILDYPLEQGVHIADADVSSGASVAVLGATPAANLFKGEYALGKTIRVDGRIFEIIGVMQGKGGFMPGADDFIMIPITTLQAKLMGDTTTEGRPVQTIAIRALSTERISSAKDEALSILRQRHHIREGEQDDFTVMDMREMLDEMKKALDVFQVFLASVGAISLVVGGIGIMNIMLVSVQERTHEIGIRKAVGARRRDIIEQFLVESALLSLIGGVIGILIAFLGAAAVNGVNIGGYPMQAPFTLDIVLIAVAVSTAIGICSGLYPAYRAAGMDPVESLRYQ